ncbi:MAG: ABC transporter ATP-binding protein [Alphaproteobacteria bacterium]
MLRIEGLSRNFDGLAALTDVALDIADEGIYGLIGPNGSGKTTLFNVVTGVYAPSAGSIEFDGAEIGGLEPRAVIAHGIARTFQNLRLYRRMTVFDNVLAAQHSLPEISRWELIFARRGPERDRRDEALGLLEMTGLADRRDELAASLPLPDQRRLELARALARAPKLLLLDEPAGGMTPAETEDMAALIRDVAAPGRACVVIEHKMDMIAALCGRITVLNFGRKIAEGEPREVLREPAVLEAYLGVVEDGAEGAGHA